MFSASIYTSLMNNNNVSTGFRVVDKYFRQYGAIIKTIKGSQKSHRHYVQVLKVLKGKILFHYLNEAVQIGNQ